MFESSQLSKGKNKGIKCTYLPHSNRCRTIKKLRVQLLFLRLKKGGSKKKNVKKRGQSPQHLCNWSISPVSTPLSWQNASAPGRRPFPLGLSNLWLTYHCKCQRVPPVPSPQPAYPRKRPLLGTVTLYMPFQKSRDTLSNLSLLKCYINKMARVC